MCNLLMVIDFLKSCSVCRMNYYGFLGENLNSFIPIDFLKSIKNDSIKDCKLCRPLAWKSCGNKKQQN